MFVGGLISHIEHMWEEPALARLFDRQAEFARLIPMGDDLGGMAVHIAARVSALAAPHEVLASGTTYGTVVGSGLSFEDRGSHALKGVPGYWSLFALER